MKININEAKSAKVKPANYLRSLYENMKLIEDSDNPPLKLEHEESKLDKTNVVTIRLPIRFLMLQLERWIIRVFNQLHICVE